MLYAAPAVIVHERAHLDQVLALGRPVVLCSAPAAALYMGCGWWVALLAAYTGPSLLDCADAPGRALEALREGLPGLILAPQVPAYNLVAQIAAKQGAVLLPAMPPALDMTGHGAARRLPSWLKCGESGKY
jgi:hypothetical protein